MDTWRFRFPTRIKSLVTHDLSRLLGVLFNIYPLFNSGKKTTVKFQIKHYCLQFSDKKEIIPSLNIFYVFEYSLDNL